MDKIAEKTVGILKWIGKVILAILLTIISSGMDAILDGILVYFLWNWLMPEIFQLTSISFIQAIGITFLFKLLLNVGTKEE